MNLKIKIRVTINITGVNKVIRTNMAQRDWESE